MIKINDFIDKSRVVQWAQYKKAKRDAGEECYKCSGFIPYHYTATPGPAMCGSCKNLENNPGQVFSERLVRCPTCSHQQEIDTYDDYSVYEEGEHEVMCNNCEEEYTISTSITYTFKSPRLN